MNTRTTNSDIISILELHHKETTARLEAIEVQALKTNGRVTSIENWKNALEAVDAYKETLAPAVAVAGDVVVKATAGKLDAQSKFWLALAGLVTAVAGIAALLAGKL